MLPASLERNRPLIAVPPSGKHQRRRAVPALKDSRNSDQFRHSPIGPLRLQLWPDLLAHCHPVVALRGAAPRSNRDDAAHHRAAMRLWSPFRYRAQPASIVADERSGSGDRSTPSWAQRLNVCPQDWLGVCYRIVSLHLNPLDFYDWLQTIIEYHCPMQREKTTRRWFF